MNTENPTPVRSRPLGLSAPAMIGLAALAVPRPVLQDLGIIEEGDLAVWLLALIPFALWVAVVVLRQVPKPFLTLLVVGAIFGAMLVITHQLLWDLAFADGLPTVNGSPLVPRLAAIPSGLFTGAIIGAILGLVAWGLQSLVLRRQRA